MLGVGLLMLPLLILILSLAVLYLERRLIGIAQKRLGISFLGRNGWAHLPADLLKFWLKHNRHHLAGWLGSLGGLGGGMLAYLGWSLLGSAFVLGDGGAALLDFWEYQLLAYLAYAGVSSLFLFGVVLSMRSKYATLAAARLALATIALDVVFAALFLLLYWHIGGFALTDAQAGSGGGLFLTQPGVACLFLLFLLFETKRAPFDHAEAESELVAGHLVEFGGRSLLFMYMCEYVHLVLGLGVGVLLLLGGGLPAALLPAVGLDVAMAPLW